MFKEIEEVDSHKMYELIVDLATETEISGIGTRGNGRGMLDAELKLNRYIEDAKKILNKEKRNNMNKSVYSPRL